MSIVTDPVIGVDVGASTISAGLVAADGTVLASAQEPTGETDPIDTIVALIDHILVLADREHLRVAGIGLGLPGPVDVVTGRMRGMHGGWMPGLADRPLAVNIHERSLHARNGHHRIFVDNDANALALAEWMFGPGRGASSLVTLAIGTGIGGGIVIDGTLLRGRLGAAGEIGHVAVSPDGPRCACGSAGCVAAYASGRLMAERARERLPHYPGSRVLADAGGDPQRISARLLYEAAAAGDPLARTIVDEACEALAVALGTLATLLNPEVIVITGGVAASLAPLADDLRRRARRHTLPGLLDATAVHVTPADKRSTMRGGAALVLYELARAARTDMRTESEHVRLPA